jgi:predicted methyltransferase
MSPEQVIAASDRSAADRDLDERRQPARLLQFLGVRVGERVADLGTGSGYTAELLARAVGRIGQVYAHSDRQAPADVKRSLDERMQRGPARQVIKMELDYEAPLSTEATNLDLVTFLFAYHDAVAKGVNRSRLNAAVFQALRPGGLYVIADHAAEPFAGTEVAARLHRIAEQLVRSEVESAGFKLVDRADFVREPNDDPRRPSSAGGFHTNRFILKFRKSD